MNIEKFREIIKRIDEIDPEWYTEIEKCWKEEIKVLTEDIPSTIEFLKNECTAYEYVWISEVIIDIVEDFPDKELVQCYKDLRYKYPEKYKEYYIDSVNEDLDAILEWEKEQGEGEGGD